jgi:hypothetical protein
VFNLHIRFRCCCRRRLSALFSSPDQRLAGLDGILPFSMLRSWVFRKECPGPCIANCSFARVSLLCLGFFPSDREGCSVFSPDASLAAYDLASREVFNFPGYLCPEPLPSPAWPVRWCECLMVLLAAPGIKSTLPVFHEHLGFLCRCAEAVSG